MNLYKMALLVSLVLFVTSLQRTIWRYTGTNGRCAGDTSRRGGEHRF